MRRPSGRLFAKLPLIITVPISFLKGRTLSRLHAFFVISTFLSIFLSTLLLVLVSAGTNGVDHELGEKIAGLDSHILLSMHQRDELICEYDELEQKISGGVSLVRGIAPYLWVDIQLRSNAGALLPVLLKGVIPNREQLATDVDRYLSTNNLQGALSVPRQEVPLVIGRTIAESLGVHVGETIVLLKPGLATVRSFPAFVADVFETGTPHDSEVAYTTLQQAQSIYGTHNNCVHAIAVRTNDPLTSASAASSLQRLLGDRFDVADWSIRYPNYKAGLQLLKAWILGLNYVIFAFAVMFSSGVVLLVLSQKRREIALLLSLGMHPLAVRLSVGIVGTLLGTIGVAAAVMLGPLLCRILTEYQIVRLPAEQTLLTYVPFMIGPTELAMIAAGQILVPTAFGWFVAGDVRRLTPAAILRDE